jgi:hypothetical protein
MRGLPRRSMLRLAQPIMIGCDAALGTALRPEGGCRPLLSPAPSAATSASQYGASVT